MPTSSYSDPSIALQAALSARLAGWSALAAMIGPTKPRIYDEVPTNASGQVTATFPYLTIGDDQITGDDDEAHETSEAHVQVEVWSRAGGYPEAKRIAGAVRDAMGTPLDLTPNGHRVVTFSFVSALPRREPDGKTRRVIVLFRIISQPI